VPLDLPVERPVRLGERPLPERLEHGPVVVADGDAAEREEAALVEPPALVEEEEVHGRRRR
jgi:hypothetical protein